MPETREFHEFEADPILFLEIALASVIVSCTLIIHDIQNAIGNEKSSFITVSSNSPIFLLTMFLVLILSVYNLSLIGFRSLEVRDTGKLRCLSLLRRMEFPIADIEALVLEENEIEGEYIYFGHICFKGRKLNSVSLNKYECLRLRAFFQSLERRNGKIVFRDEVNYTRLQQFE